MQKNLVSFSAMNEWLIIIKRIGKKSVSTKILHKIMIFYTLTYNQTFNYKEKEKQRIGKLW